MPTETGEYIVGAYLQHIHDCGVVLFNVRNPGGGLKGLNELDVLGLNLRKKEAYLCEVTTHLRGMSRDTFHKMPNKHQQQKKYAAEHLDGFSIHYMLWSPSAPSSLIFRVAVSSILPNLQ